MPYVAPTCLTTGTVEHYACSGCSTLFADAEGKQQIETSIIIPYLTHETADDWSMDETFHWRSCKLCKTLLDETKMQHDMTEGKCTTCNYAIGDRVTDPGTTPAETAPEADHNTEQDNNAWIKILLVALVCFAAAITTTVIILKKKKGE